ncbi:MAG: UDP-N-acetylmuramoyl-tripeptide--D-alanyl-D-alanine ligase [Frankiaceae bacterium]|nr:UDP-N-acetylmuramoyl-tripeptide--D-alanyl-D-alanine ligase [Frankiaceae bacterium]
MIALGLEDICRSTGGRLAGAATPQLRVTGTVVIDSRRCEPGSLFVCLPGETADGHDFAAAAVAAGAVAVLAARDVGVPAIVVDDPQRALGSLAAGVLAAAPGCRVIGITGSVGKTSTKDLLAQVLAHRGPTVAPENSFNNEIGLPLTVLRIDERTCHLVCEYSARGVGHIRYLCGIARPTIAVVLNVGAAHLGEFGSRAGVAAAKGELVEALPADGVAVLNADDPLVLGMRTRTNARVVTFGTAADADVRVVDLRLDDLARPHFRLVAGPGDVAVALQDHGAHLARNAAAVVAAALAAGLDLEAVAAALGEAQIRSAHRMAVRRRDDGLVVVDDAYNANPESVRAALDALAAMAGGRRRWAVLGEMRELGDGSAELHREVGAYAAATGVEEIVAVGPAAEPIAAGARSTAGWAGRVRTVADADAARRSVQDEVVGGEVVLVKASNSLQFWHIAEALLAAVPAGARGR